MTIKHTEKSIQDILFNYYCYDKHHSLIVPNVSLFSKRWEADLVTVTKSNLTTELEIKTSRGDYLNDFRNKVNKHKALKLRYKKIPNYFYFCVGSQFVKLSEIPEYSGLLFIKKDNTVKVIKKAPLLHSVKIPVRQRNYLERGLVYRYWSLRLKNNKTEMGL